jgi:hypothetical protein
MDAPRSDTHGERRSECACFGADHLRGGSSVVTTMRAARRTAAAARPGPRTCAARRQRERSVPNCHVGRKTPTSGPRSPIPPARAQNGSAGRSRWQRFVDWLSGDPRRHADEILAENSILETRLADQLSRHAERFVRYPAAHRDLMVLAGRAAEATRDLATAIERRGGRVPALAPHLDEARTDWERLVADRDALREAPERSLDDAYAAERDHPDVSALLLELREREAADYRTLVKLLTGFERAVLDQPDERRGAVGAPIWLDTSFREPAAAFMKGAEMDGSPRPRSATAPTLDPGELAELAEGGTSAEGLVMNEHGRGLADERAPGSAGTLIATDAHVQRRSVPGGGGAVAQGDRGRGLRTEVPSTGPLCGLCSPA